MSGKASPASTHQGHGRAAGDTETPAVAHSAAEPASASVEAAPAQADAGDPNGAGEPSECPFCVMMRRGGCEPQFKAFMECGEKVDKDSGDYALCLDQFSALQECMERNKDVFEALMQEVREQDGVEAAAQPVAAAAAAGVAADGPPIASSD